MKTMLQKLMPDLALYIGLFPTPTLFLKEALGNMD